MKKAVVWLLMIMLCVVLPVDSAKASDLDGHWAAGVMHGWIDRGYISGYGDGSFRPDQSITRAEFIKLVNKAKGYTIRGDVDFTDVVREDWFYVDLQIAMGQGYISGFSDGSFQPNAPVTRAQAAAIVARTQGLIGDSDKAAKFADSKDIPSWAAGNIGAVSNAGLMNGYEDNTFQSENILTRAEGVAILDRVLYNIGSSAPSVNVTIRTAGVTLSDRIIEGDLNITKDVGSGTVTVKNVTVKGTVNIYGGGLNSVYFENCTLNGVTVARNEGKVRVVLRGNTSAKTVQLNKPTNVELQGTASITTMNVASSGKTSIITLYSNGDIDTVNADGVITIYGTGVIKTLNANVTGIVSEIKPIKVNTASGITTPTIELPKGQNQGDVTLSGSADKLYNTTVEGDLIIASSVSHEVTIRDVTVKGKVYVYGGGSGSNGVKILGKSKIEDLIIDRSGRSVRVVVADEATVKNVTVDYGYSAVYLEGKMTNLLVDSPNISIDLTNATISKMEVSSRNNSISVNSGTVNNLKLNSTADDGYVDIGQNAKVTTLYTAADDSTIRVNGTVTNIETYDPAEDVTITVGSSGSVSKVLLKSRYVTVSGSGKVSTVEVKGDDCRIYTYGTKVVVDKGIDNTRTNQGYIAAGTTVTTSAAPINTSSISLNQSALTLKRTDNAVTLIATVLPSDAADKTVYWSTSNGQIASVNSNGVVTAISAGQATITARASGGQTASCIVTVPMTTEEEDMVTIQQEMNRYIDTITMAKVSAGGAITKAQILVLKAGESVNINVAKQIISTSNVEWLQVVNNDTINVIAEPTSNSANVQVKFSKGTQEVIKNVTISFDQ